MKIMNVVILGLAILYTANLFVCGIYCRKKRQMQKFKSNIIVAGGEITNQRDFKFYIKQLLYGWIMYSVKCLGKVPCQKYRTFMLKHVFLMDIKHSVVIYSWDMIRAPWNISIGEGTVVGEHAYLDGRNTLTIGKNVNISTGVSIYTEQHDINDPYFRSLDSGGSVVIGDRAWLSSHTTVLPNVIVGEGAVLASSALTAKDLEPYGIYVGVPAVKKGERNKELRYEFDGTYVPFI